jgi:hypothetical protein
MRPNVRDNIFTSKARFRVMCTKAASVQMEYVNAKLNTSGQNGRKVSCVMGDIKR